MRTLRSRRPLEGAVLLGLICVVCAILGVTLTALVAHRDASLEAIANVGVAVGTVGLAYFTWKSVVRTGDIIGSEDRRHQQSFAPLLLVPDVPWNGKPRVTFQNVGMGMARNIALYIIGTYSGSAFIPGRIPNENWPLVEGSVWQGYYSVVPPPPSLLSTLQDAPMQDATPPNPSYDIFGAQQVFITYEDMFGNPYSTIYNDYAEDKSFEWEQPNNLKSIPAN